MKNYKFTDNSNSVVVYTDAQGRQHSHVLEAKEFQDWLADGHTIDEVLPAYSQAELDQQHLEVEKAWVKSELELADVEVRKFNDGHTRTAGTLPAWRTYRNALRDYIQSDVIIGSRPVSP